ncbi:MAG TPA: LemA family protein [Burkholderiaceae bacterium]|jgi:LemA protein|nr:LemA family protein [Burkholderiaceae bacterium]
MSSTRIVMVAVLTVLAFWIVGAYNRLMRLRSAVVAAWPPLDSQLRRRHALVIELAQTLNAAGASPVEEQMIEAAQAASTQAQAAASHVTQRPMNAGAVQSLGLAEQVLERALAPLREIVSGRPALVTEPEGGEQIESLTDALGQADTQLAFARHGYNEAVAAYNHAAREIPTRMVAMLFGFVPTAALAGEPAGAAKGLGGRA